MSRDAKKKNLKNLLREKLKNKRLQRKTIDARDFMIYELKDKLVSENDVEKQKILKGQIERIENAQEIAFDQETVHEGVID